MKVFLSWSGPLSKRLAESFRKWLPAVLQAVRPYYSPDDITKGSRWSSEIGKELEECKVGLIFLTRENLSAPWIMFEAGALSKKLDKSNVCPLLFEIEPSDIEGPLVQFQAAKFDKDEVKRVVKMMNSLLADAALAPDVFDGVFEMWWPQLEWETVETLADEGTSRPTAVRSERQLLEEVLDLSRTISVALSREEPQRGLNPQLVIDLIEDYSTLASQMKGTGVFNAQRKLLLEMAEPMTSLILRLDASKVDLKALDGLLRKARTELKNASSFKEDPSSDVPF